MTSDIKGFGPHCDHSGMGGLPWDRARRIVAERSKDIASFCLETPIYKKIFRAQPEISRS